MTGPERSDGLVGDGQCVCAAYRLVADSTLFGCLCRRPAHSRVVPHSAVVPRAVVEDCPAHFMLASLESSPRARRLAQQHLAEDGPIDPAPSGAAWRPGHLARLGQCEGSRTDGLQVCGDTGQRCEQGIAQLSQSLRIVISQRLQRVMPAVRARPGANRCSHPLSRPHGIAQQVCAVLLGGPGIEEVVYQCQSARAGPDPVAGDRPPRSPRRCVACLSVTVIDPIILWHKIFIA